MKSYDVAIRSDASIEIGTGHIMRCLTLANSIRERGGRCCFICRQHVGNLITQIREKGFDVVELPVHDEFPSSERDPQPHVGWLGVSWNTDVVETINAIEGKVDWLIVDHYSIDKKWENEVRKVCRRLMVIDDLADRPHDCDLFLDQNFGREKKAYNDLLPMKCTTFIGAKYALLRSEFSEYREYSLKRRRQGQIKAILISMGGVDKKNTTSKVLDVLNRILLPQDIKINVVRGVHSPWLEHVKEKAADMLFETKVLVNVENMAELMAESDLAIGGAGTSTWERCCLGLPSIIIIQAQNQREGAFKMNEIGAALLVRDIDNLSTEMSMKINALMNKQELIAMQDACLKVTEGRGVYDIVAALGCVT